MRDYSAGEKVLSWGGVGGPRKQTRWDGQARAGSLQGVFLGSTPGKGAAGEGAGGRGVTLSEVGLSSQS